MITFEVVGQRIKDNREALDMSQKDLAIKLEGKGFKMGRETISKIETGIRATNALELKAIGVVLNVAPEILLKEEEESDLVTMFRTKCGTLTDEGAVELGDIQMFARSLIAQKKIDTGERKIKKFTPSWR